MTGIKFVGKDPIGNARAINTDGNGNLKVGLIENNPIVRMAHRVTELVELNINTYDGSDQPVHPSVLYIPHGFGGHKYWMGMTPFPNNQSVYENPSILYSDDGISWSDVGISNPIVPQPVSASNDFNRDLELLYNDATNELWLYWTNELLVSPYTWQTYRKRSTDGIAWGAAEPITRVYNQPSNGFGFCAMAWTQEIGTEGAWSVWDPSTATADTIGRSYSIDGLNWYSGAKALSNLKGLHHLSVLKYAGGYHFLAPSGSRTKGSHFSYLSSLHYGYSKDGHNIEWDTAPLIMPSPLIANYYRSSMIPISDTTLRVYTSYCKLDNTWHMGYFDIELTGLGNQVPPIGETMGEKIEIDLCKSLAVRDNVTGEVMWNKKGLMVGDDAKLNHIPLWDKFKKKTLLVQNSLGVDVNLWFGSDAFVSFKPIKSKIKTDGTWDNESIVIPNDPDRFYLIDDALMPILSNLSIGNGTTNHRTILYAKATTVPTTGTLSIKLIMEN